MGRLAEIRAVHRRAERLELAREILAALEQHGWRLCAAAAALGESPTALRRVIESEGLGPILAEHGVRRGRPRGSLGRRRREDRARQSAAAAAPAPRASR